MYFVYSVQPEQSIQTQSIQIQIQTISTFRIGAKSAANLWYKCSSLLLFVSFFVCFVLFYVCLNTKPFKRSKYRNRNSYFTMKAFVFSDSRSLLVIKLRNSVQSTVNKPTEYTREINGNQTNGK